MLEFHRKHVKLATLIAVQTSGKFGVLDLNGGVKVNSFMKKPKGDGSWINGGFFVLEPEIFEYLQEGENTIWERTPLENLAKNNELYAYKHLGFWRPMDTLRDKVELENMWNSNKCEWKVWK